MWRHKELLGLFLVYSTVSLCQTKVVSASRQARLTLAQPMPYYYHNNIDGHPGTYSYGYDVSDPATGNSQFRTEERYPNGTVIGSYGYVDAWGRPQRFRYVADGKGYRVMRDRPNMSSGVPISPSFNPGSSTESSITWTRPRKPNKKKINNYYNRPINNFIAPPSSYAED